MDRGRRGARAGRGTTTPSIAPYGLFHTADAPVQIACGSDGAVAAAVRGCSASTDDAVRHATGDRVLLREELTTVMEQALSA